MPTIKVFLAHDQAITRAGLRLLLEAAGDVVVVGEAGDGEGTLAAIGVAAPDVVVMELRLPRTCSFELIARVTRDYPPARVVVLSAHDREPLVRAALGAGALAFVSPRASSADLLAAIRAARAGRTLRVPVAPDRRSVGSADATPRHRLSRRELEVLALMGQGLKLREIADRLAISEKTVETYRARITEKLGLRTRAEFVRFALDAGLIGVEGMPGSAAP